MKATRLLPLAITLLLAACGPSVDEPVTLTPAQPQPVAKPEPEPEPPKPVKPPNITATGANSAFDLAATRDGKQVKTRFADGSHYVETPRYVLGLSFSPNELLSVDHVAYQKYQDSDTGIAGTEMLLRLLQSGPTGFEFSLANNSSVPIQIIWDETAIVTVDGSSSRVIHQGIKYSEMNNSQPPTVVPPGARVDEYAGPTNLITYNDAWNAAALVSDFDKGTKASFFLVLNVNGERQNLNFAFTANRDNEIFRGGEDLSALNKSNP